MSVTVTPQEFHLVLFDAAAIERVAEDLIERLGVGPLSLAVEVDETTPIARIDLVDGDPVVVRAESGAFEDPKRPRHLSEASVATSLGRVLLRRHDRAHGYADAPADDALMLAEQAAWDVACLGRLERAGYPANRQRWLYNFRNRHGFTDATDAVFDRLWDSSPPTWAALAAASEQATLFGRGAS